MMMMMTILLLCVSCCVVVYYYYYYVLSIIIIIHETEARAGQAIISVTFRVAIYHTDKLSKICWWVSKSPFFMGYSPCTQQLSAVHH